MMGKLREGSCCTVVKYYSLVQVGLVLDKGVTLFASDTILHLYNNIPWALQKKKKEKQPHTYTKTKDQYF